MATTIIPLVPHGPRLPLRSGRRYSLRLTLASGGAVLIALLAIPVATGDRQEPADPAFGLDTGLLETGDLIFRRGQSIASRLVLLADTQSVYSHVGLVLMGGSEALVVHVVPAETADNLALVRVEPLANFIDARHASAISVRRLDHARARQYASLAATAACAYAREALSFDVSFDLDSEDRLYCTELVWRAYLEAGIDLVDGVFVRLETPFGSGSFLTLSSLLKSRYLREIVSLPT